MIIRTANQDDISIWSEMRTALWPDTDDAHLSEINSYFDGKAIDIADIFLAELDKLVIGFLEINIRSFAEGSRNIGVPYVEGWYIQPAYQGKGYGKKLMQHAELWSIAQGYTELASDTEIDNQRSIAMHKHLGFTETERVVCFLKSLKTIS